MASVSEEQHKHNQSTKQADSPNNMNLEARLLGIFLPSTIGFQLSARRE